DRRVRHGFLLRYAPPRRSSEQQGRGPCLFGMRLVRSVFCGTSSSKSESSTFSTGSPTQLRGLTGKRWRGSAHWRRADLSAGGEAGEAVNRRGGGVGGQHQAHHR